MPGYEVLCSDDPLWHPRKARSGPSGQIAAAALQALGLPPPPATLSSADLFAAHTLDGFVHEEPRARSPRLKTLGVTAPRAAATAHRGLVPWPSPRPNVAIAVLEHSPPADQAPRSTAAKSSRPACTDRPTGRGEHLAVQEETLHEAQAACRTAARGAAEPVGVCQTVLGETAGAQPPPRSPAALQRYNGLSPAEALALEHVHTAEGAPLFTQESHCQCTSLHGSMNVGLQEVYKVQYKAAVLCLPGFANTVCGCGRCGGLLCEVWAGQCCQVLLLPKACPAQTSSLASHAGRGCSHATLCCL